METLYRDTAPIPRVEVSSDHPQGALGLNYDRSRCVEHSPVPASLEPRSSGCVDLHDPERRTEEAVTSKLRTDSA